MSFTPKYLTQGGQMTAYRLRMFAQVNQWIFNWLFLLFLLSTGGVFWAVTSADVLNNGFWYRVRNCRTTPRLSVRHPACLPKTKPCRTTTVLFGPCWPPLPGRVSLPVQYCRLKTHREAWCLQKHSATCRPSRIKRTAPLKTHKMTCQSGRWPARRVNWKNRGN